MRKRKPVEMVQIRGRTVPLTSLRAWMARAEITQAELREETARLDPAGRGVSERTIRNLCALRHDPHLSAAALIVAATELLDPPGVGFEDLVADGPKSVRVLFA